MSTEYRQQPQNDACTCQDRETNGNTSDADTDRIMSVYIECLSRPEHENGEEVSARNESDDERETENARFLA